MKSSTVLSILMFFVTVVLLVVVAFLLIHTMSSQIFMEAYCPENNGTYWEVQNVTCMVQYPNCFMMCELPNGTSINYYDAWSSTVNLSSNEVAV